MDVIKSLKNLFFNGNKNKDQILNKNKRQIEFNEEYSIEYYKNIFKSNYRLKKLNKIDIEINQNFINPNKEKKENLSILKIKVNKCKKNDLSNFSINLKENKNEKIFKKATLSPVNKSKLKLNENNYDSNTSFFYILKGAVLIIEDWWKKILKIKNKNKIIIKRCINNKNYKIFSNKNKNK